jgi:predicted DNA-binding protein (MmcQ/YjbR family)
MPDLKCRVRQAPDPSPAGTARASDRSGTPVYHPPVPDIDRIRKFCLSLPNSTENMQWGEDLCFKVAGKLFTVVDLSKGQRPPVCFKCTPEKFLELLEIEGIAPAPYVGRYKWVILEHADILPKADLEDLIRQSYEMVVAKAPKKKKSTRKPAPKPRRSK